MLDARNFKDWLDLCAEEFTYVIRAFSPEIRRDMVFLDLDLEGSRRSSNICRAITPISRRLRAI